MFDIGKIIDAGATIGSAYIGAKSSEKGIKATNAANAQMARDQMAFQERMDNSKYQRGVADAKLAGFNPLVAFPGHAGSPIGASAVMQNPTSNRGELAISTAKAAADIMLTREMANTEETKQELNRAQANNLGGDLSFPGFLRVPINRFRGVFNRNSSTAKSIANSPSDSGSGFRLANLFKKGGR